MESLNSCCILTSAFHIIFSHFPIGIFTVASDLDTVVFAILMIQMLTTVPGWAAWLLLPSLVKVRRQLNKPVLLSFLFKCF